MVGITTLLVEAQIAGLELRADGERLVIRGPRECEALAKELLAHKVTIPANWLAGVSRLTSMTRPAGTSSERWAVLVADAGSFLEKWGAQAVRLGWGTLDVFGVNVTRPFERLDGAGLVRLLDGRPVVALTASEAVIQCLTGSRQTFRRKPASNISARRCALWQLALRA